MYCLQLSMWISKAVFSHPSKGFSYFATDIWNAKSFVSHHSISHIRFKRELSIITYSKLFMLWYFTLINQVRLGNKDLLTFLHSWNNFSYGQSDKILIVQCNSTQKTLIILYHFTNEITWYEFAKYLTMTSCTVLQALQKHKFYISRELYSAWRKRLHCQIANLFLLLCS